MNAFRFRRNARRAARALHSWLLADHPRKHECIQVQTNRAASVCTRGCGCLQTTQGSMFFSYTSLSPREGGGRKRGRGYEPKLVYMPRLAAGLPVYASACRSSKKMASCRHSLDNPRMSLLSNRHLSARFLAWRRRPPGLLVLERHKR